MTIKRLSHAVYDTRYHLVWAPKYRKWILKEKLRDAVKELFEEILKARDCEVKEMEIAEDCPYIHQYTTQIFCWSDCESSQKCECKRDLSEISRGKERVVGRRILGRWIFCPNSWRQSHQ